MLHPPRSDSGRLSTSLGGSCKVTLTSVSPLCLSFPFHCPAARCERSHRLARRPSPCSRTRYHAPVRRAGSRSHSGSAAALEMCCCSCCVHGLSEIWSFSCIHAEPPLPIAKVAELCAMMWKYFKQYFFLISDIVECKVLMIAFKFAADTFTQ